jgi:anti-sigma factor RsiW
MTGTDPFELDDGAYVLGALDDDERRAYEAHLETCAPCRARVAELRDTAALLSALPRSAGADLLTGAPPAAFGDLVAEPSNLPVRPVDPMPDTLLPGLLRRVRRERVRRRFLTAGIGAVAAACLVAIALVLAPNGSSPGPAHRPAAVAMVAVKPSPVSATARLISRGWGTQIEVHCTYPSYERGRFAYRLVVIDKANKAHDAGDWTLVPGKSQVDFTSGTSVATGQIARVQIRTPTGTPVLELNV